MCGFFDKVRPRQDLLTPEGVESFTPPYLPGPEEVSLSGATLEVGIQALQAALPDNVFPRRAVSSVRPGPSSPAFSEEFPAITSRGLSPALRGRLGGSFGCTKLHRGPGWSTLPGHS